MRHSKGTCKALCMIQQLGPDYHWVPLFFAGFLRPHPHVSHSSAFPEVSAALNPSQYLRNWILSSKPAADETTAAMHRWAAGTNSAGIRTGRSRTRSDSASLGKQAQMLEMITALEELQRAVNSTLSSRITVMSRGNCFIYFEEIQAFAFVSTNSVVLLQQMAEIRGEKINW